MNRIVWLLIIFMSLFLAQYVTAREDQVCFGKHCIDVEIAREPQELSRGLQFRKSLAQDTGMLFVFSQSGLHRFWMKDTIIPLDMIWIDADKRIVYIAADVPPCEKDPCPTYGATQEALYVLEINAGDASRLGLHLGDRAVFDYGDGEYN